MHLRAEAATLKAGSGQCTSALGFFLLLSSVFFVFCAKPASANDFSYPWRDKSRAIVIDAYEKNPIDWQKLVSNKQIVGFIGKSSDGLPPPWGCRKPNITENTLCRKTFQNYWLKKELYKTRRMVAKSLGLKWGAYHLGRPGNPIDQANHFIDFTQPDDDDLLALDIEHDDPKKWISLKDAEIFVKHIKRRIGRYPILYTNHNTAKRIAARRAELPTLSRLPLWYARFKGDIRGAFPMGNWDTYAIWQFSAQANCNKRRCLYRVAGAKNDIDVNVAPMSEEALRTAWPFGELLPEKPFPQELPGFRMAEAEVPEERAAAQGDGDAGPPARPTRFEMELTIAADDGEPIVLSSIAVPTARTPVALALGLNATVFAVAQVDIFPNVARFPPNWPAVEVADLSEAIVEEMMPPADEMTTGDVSNRNVQQSENSIGERYSYTHYSTAASKSDRQDRKYGSKTY